MQIYMYTNKLTLQFYTQLQKTSVTSRGKSGKQN